MKTILTLLLAFSVCTLFSQQKSFKPGAIWPDNNGVHINAHGGGILNYNGIYYWFGEDTTSLIQKGCVIERAKVIYNKKSKQFVMWFHHELKGMGYAAAMTGVAVSKSVAGPYTWLKSDNPNAGIWPV